MAIGLENPFPPPARLAAPRRLENVGGVGTVAGGGGAGARHRRFGGGGRSGAVAVAVAAADARGGDTKGFLLFEFYISVSPGHRTGTATRHDAAYVHARRDVKNIYFFFKSKRVAAAGRRRRR